MYILDLFNENDEDFFLFEKAVDFLFQYIFISEFTAMLLYAYNECDDYTRIVMMFSYDIITSW